MVSNISYKISTANGLVSGFGIRSPKRKPRATARKPRAHTHVLVPISAIGGMVHRKRTVHHRVAHHTVHHAGSYKIAGSGIHKRRPARRHLTHRRKTAGTGIRRRAPIRHLGGMRKRTVHHRRLVLI